MTNTTPQEHTAAVELTAKQERSAAYMADPSSWNNLFCPVVRSWDKAPNHCGQVNPIAALDGRCEIIVGNIWDSKCDWENATRMLYPSFEAAVLDGWRVD